MQAIRSSLLHIVAVIVTAALLTGAYCLYAGYRSPLEVENVATAVAIIFFILGALGWRPLSFAHGAQLTQDGERVTPSTANPRNQARGLLIMIGGVLFLGVVIGIH